MNVIGMQVLLSLALAFIFLASAVPKLRHPSGFVLAVLEYRVLPARLSWVYARMVPPLELLLVLLLLSGTAVRSVAIVMSLLLLSFITAVGTNLARGRHLDCHCFGKASSRPFGWRLLLEDAALLGTALALAVITQEWVAPESWSVFRLSGLVSAGSLAPLLGCVVVTACTTAFLSRSIYNRRPSGTAVVRK